VSGKSFPELTRERLFVPNGMTHSSWRDDYTRVVKGRATAYDPNRDGSYSADMDIENIYGNCCLLTTVGDLLRWNLNFRGPVREQMSVPVALAGGIKTDYGFGLFTGSDGETYHSGATAGWRAFLSHRPKDGLDVAVICNRGDAGTGSLVDKVAAAFGSLSVPLPPASGDQKASDGLYVDKQTDAILRIKDNAIVRGPKLMPIGENRFRAGRNVELRFDGDTLHLVTIHKPEAIYTRMPEATPKLDDYAGSYASDEVGATYVIVVEKGKLVAKIAPGQSFELEPTYADAFSAGGTLAHFTRGRNGRVDGVDIKSDFGAVEGSARVERMHFTRLP